MAKVQQTPHLWPALAVTRILLGFVFFWAFIDKSFGLGYATPAAKAWLNGGSPTTGFLSGVEGPFAGFFNSLAGQVWADWLFMVGLFGIGAALILGVAVRIAAVGGVIMLSLMWMAVLPLTTNPIIDDHTVYAAVLVVIALALPNQRLSLQGWWRSLAPVKNNPWLW